MIIWLASYPKSGNTLLRSILASYFFSKDGNFNFNHLDFINQFPTISQFSKLGIDTSNEKEIFRNFIEAQKLMNKEEKSIKFLKTHSSLSKINNVNFTDFNNSLGAIYIVRDPRNVVTSFAHHYGLSIEQSTNIMIDEKKWLSKTDTTYKTFLGSWNINYNSWKQFKNNLLLIKYEDLVSKKKTTLIKIFKFLKNLTNNSFEIDMVKLNKSIKSTEFQRLKKLEEEKVFTESMIDNATGKRRKFFRLGKANNWKLHLDKKFTNIIERKFEKEMIELGYL